MTSQKKWCHLATLCLPSDDFSPLFLLLKVYINSDVAYAMIMAVFAFTDTYVKVVVFMLAPKTLQVPAEQVSKNFNICSYVAVSQMFHFRTPRPAS